MLKHTYFAVSGHSSVPFPSTFYYTYTHPRHYVEVVVSYIPLELEFLNFITQIRAEYDPWLKRDDVQKFSAVSLQRTLSGTLEEVRMY